MGAWSTAIFGNDSSSEVYDYFKRMYKYQEGNRFKWTVDEIVASLYTFYADDIESTPSQKTDFYFAIAHALWEIGELSPLILKITEQLVEKRIDYNAWKELEASEKTLKKRLAATESFLQKIRIPNAAPKLRQLSPPKLSEFLHGDCLAFHYRGQYYGLLVVGDGRNVDDGSNEFAFVNIRKDSLPVVEDFRHASLILNEELVNAILGIAPQELANPPVAFVFRFNRGAVQKAKQEFVYIGQLPLVRTHFEWRSVRVTTAPCKISSVKKLVDIAADHWEKHPWKISCYKLGSDTRNPGYAVTGEMLTFAGYSIPLENIHVKIENSLWHVDVWMYVKGVPFVELESHWLVFSDYVEKKTGREVNVFTLLDENDTKSSEMLPVGKIEFEKYKLKHVEDSAII